MISQCQCDITEQPMISQYRPYRTVMLHCKLSANCDITVCTKLCSANCDIIDPAHMVLSRFQMVPVTAGASGWPLHQQDSYRDSGVTRLGLWVGPWLTETRRLICQWGPGRMPRSSWQNSEACQLLLTWDLKPCALWPLAAPGKFGDPSAEALTWSGLRVSPSLSLSLSLPVSLRSLGLQIAALLLSRQLKFGITNPDCDSTAATPAFLAQATLSVSCLLKSSSW